MNQPTGHDRTSPHARRRPWRRGLRGIQWISAIAAVAAFWFHEVLPPVYDYAPPTPFTGNRWYNPYEVSGGEPHWLRGCFHAHSRAWGGLTDGDSSERVIWEAYRAIGTDVVGISNYQSIRPSLEDEPLYVPVYEHGYAIRQHHFSMIGAKEVSWMDFPIYKRLRHKQYMIDHLRPRTEFLVINHPTKNGAFDGESLRYLSGFHALEIATGSCRPFTRGTRGNRPASEEARQMGPEVWDVALSAGRAVWGLCGDDSHGLEDPDDIGRGWVWVDVGDAPPDRQQAALFDALRAGRFYGVWTRRDQDPPTRLVSMSIRDEVLHVEFADAVSAIRFIGQDGQLRHEVIDTPGAEYALTSDDTYVRVEAVTIDALKNEGITLFLNPVYRYESNPLHLKTATAKATLTWITRLSVVLGPLLLVYFVRRWIGRRVVPELR